MYARKWLSNSEIMLQKIPVEDRAAELNLEAGSLPATKTFGLIWLAKEDTLTFEVSQISAEFNFIKAKFLEENIYVVRPLRILAPFTIRAKIQILLQEMWTADLD